MVKNNNKLVEYLSKKWDYIAALFLLIVCIVVTLCIKTTIWTKVYECDEGVCYQVATVSLFYQLFINSPFFVPIIFLLLNVAVSIMGLVYNKFQKFLHIFNASLFAINFLLLIISLI